MNALYILALWLSVSAIPERQGPFFSTGGKKEMEIQKKYLRMSEACEYLGVSRSTLSKSQIPFIKLNGVRLYDVRDIDAYLESLKQVKEA